MKICVIGAGSAGLAAARQISDPKYNFSCVVFEQGKEVGGTWLYTDEIGLDEYGLPIHTSMYKNLRTNLPKEIMCFPDFKITGTEKSYVTQEVVLKFLIDYADHFKLQQYIKFKHRVKLVEPFENGWKVTAEDLETKVERAYNFDAVMICNGHYHTPSYPKIEGKELFNGIQIHSHAFRDSRNFNEKTVLVIGAGPSGMDIAIQISKEATSVFLSHQNKEINETVFPNNVKQKPNVAAFTEESVLFTDGSEEKIEAVVYCTGYLYSFQFLSDKCGITVDDNNVQHVYKHLINVKYPTMCFIGIPFYVCAFSMFDLQARFFLEYLKGNFNLPSKEKMLQEIDEEMEELYSKGFKKKHAHIMGPKQGEYYKEISTMANLRPIPPVLTKIHNLSSKNFAKNFLNFRDDVFEILDDNNFKIK